MVFIIHLFLKLAFQLLAVIIIPAFLIGVIPWWRACFSPQTIKLCQELFAICFLINLVLFGFGTLIYMCLTHASAESFMMWVMNLSSKIVII